MHRHHLDPDGPRLRLPHRHHGLAQPRGALLADFSNTLDTRFCLEALADAARVAGRAPDIVNTDQGCQYTSAAWTGAVEGLGAKVSMDGKGRRVDNVFIERLWRSLKCEDIHLRDYRDLAELERGVARWMDDYNHRRIHQALDYHKPWDCYRPQAGLAEAA